MDDRVEEATTAAGDNLLMTEEWMARMWEKRSREGSSSRGGDDKRRGKAPQKDGEPLDRDTCWLCGKTGHCKNLKETAEAHLTQVDDDEPTLLMATFYALHDVEPEPEPEQEAKEEVVAVEQGKAS